MTIYIYEKMYNVHIIHFSLQLTFNLMALFKISPLELPHMFVSFAGAFEVLGYNLSSCIHIYFAK